MGLFEKAREVAEAVQARKRQDEAEEKEILERRKAEEEAERVRQYESQVSGYVDQFLDAGIIENFKSYVMSQAEQGKITTEWVVKFPSRVHSEGFLADMDLRNATHLEKPFIEAIHKCVNDEIAPEGYTIVHSGYLGQSSERIAPENHRAIVSAVIFKIGKASEG